MLQLLTRSFKGTKTEQAVAVGKLVAERASAKGISEVVFDRGGYLYHGRVKLWLMQLVKRIEILIGGH